MIFRHERVLMVFAWTLLAVCLGCGGSDVNRATLRGKVTFQGKPVPKGLIYFEPDISRGNSGPQGFAEILDGEYRTDKVGIGAVTGPLLVRISGFSNAGQSNESPGAPLFPQYQTQIEITEETTTMDFDVPVGPGR